MKKAVVANISLALSPVPSIFLFAAMAFSMGDPPRERSSAELQSAATLTNLILLGVLFLFLLNAWLSGWSFSEAPRRSLTAFVLTLAFAIVAWNVQ